jgi:hypothetical protein
MTTTTIKIQNHDLYKNQYKINDLEKNIKNLSLKTLLKTQKLTAEFCIKYILTTDEYCWTNEETYIDWRDVLASQPHIKKNEIFDDQNESEN